MKGLIALALASFLLTACGASEHNGTERSFTKDDLKQQGKEVEVPEFNSDSAFHFIEKQLSFGPRVPNTEGHRQCAGYLEETLGRFADEVNSQRARVRAFDGTPLTIYNIEGTFYPEYEERLLLCAHWDTRPFADFSEDPERRMEPIPGANDGASGVAVLLEIARILSMQDPGYGVDIVFFDAEDYGVPHFKEYENDKDETWGLGSQYWSRNLDRENIPDRGILLDMVGAEDARFLREGYSMQFAASFTRHVWQTARRIGHSEYFIDQQTIPITDDHYFVNTLAGIPTINIIDHDLSARPRGFGDYWHTHDDDIDIISKETLQAVGETVLTVIYEGAL